MPKTLKSLMSTGQRGVHLRSELLRVAKTQNSQQYLCSGTTKLELDTSYTAKFDLSYPAVVLLDKYSCLHRCNCCTGNRVVEDVVAELTSWVHQTHGRTAGRPGWWPPLP